MKRWCLLALFLITGLVNLVRGLLAWQLSSVLTTYAPSFSLTLLGSIYGFWALGLIAEGVHCFLERRCYARWMALIYQLTLWIVRFVGDRSTRARRLWARDLILSLFFLTLVFFLSSRRDFSRSS